MNVVAHGGADIICAEFLEGFDSDVTGTGWVYIRLDGSGVYFSRDRPMYNIYLDGWYHPDNHPYGDRAVVFIDGELPQGRRAIVMDSPNSMYEYDTRMPPGNARWSIAHQITTPHDTLFTTFTLEPGVYRFELRGGNGGNGGAGGGGSNGGAGGISVAVVYELILHHTTVFQAILGGNGNAGGNGSIGSRRASGGGEGAFDWIATGGGGGSSGGDTILRTADGCILAISRGGAGGGGGGAQFSSVWLNAWRLNGGGGGGAGEPNGNDGDNEATVGFSPNEAQSGGGRGGTATNGGDGGEPASFGTGQSSSNALVGITAQNGTAGQDIPEGNRRNGGDSPDIPNLPHSDFGTSPMLGGRGGISFSGTSGWFMVRRRNML